MNEVADRLREFMENEARSCSIDFGYMTPLYVYRMWGGVVALEEIEKAMFDVRRLNFPGIYGTSEQVRAIRN